MIAPVGLVPSVEIVIIFPGGQEHVRCEKAAHPFSPSVGLMPMDNLLHRLDSFIFELGMDLSSPNRELDLNKFWGHVHSIVDKAGIVYPVWTILTLPAEWINGPIV